MNWSKRREAWKIILIVLWLVFTVTFALWWFKFSMENVALLATLEPEHVDHWNRQRRMISWEGTAWIVLLILGGVALIALVQQERLRGQRIREFFASFSHEIKTSLASLRLQAETLKEETASSDTPQSSVILDRLIADTVRLQLQLENSLFLAGQDNLQLYLQSLALSPLIERMREQWPTLKIELVRDCKVVADERALRTILSNLLQNAILHGGANQVVVEPRLDGARLAISLSDNGTGFSGAVATLGQLFYRPKSSSGSGLGLYICRLLLRHMNGELSFPPTSNKGFHANLLLKGSLS